MLRDKLYSIRMRASLRDEHVSGAERLVPEERVDTTVEELMVRALRRGCRPDQMNVTIEDLAGAPIVRLRSLDLVTLNIADEAEARAAAVRVLGIAGVSPAAAERAIALIASGPSPSNGNMRGAMILDAATGERIEPDRERGVRASRFDWSEPALAAIDERLSSLGLNHFRTREALALATKVAHAPGIVAELCWSDDPDYTAGYASSMSVGYVRFPVMKQQGNRFGGRAFFARHGGFDREACIRFLEQQTVLVAEHGACNPPVDPGTFFRNLAPRETDGA